MLHLCVQSTVQVAIRSCGGRPVELTSASLRWCTPSRRRRLRACPSTTPSTRMVRRVSFSLLCDGAVNEGVNEGVSEGVTPTQTCVSRRRSTLSSSWSLYPRCVVDGAVCECVRMVAVYKPRYSPVFDSGNGVTAVAEKSPMTFASGSGVLTLALLLLCVSMLSLAWTRGEDTLPTVHNDTRHDALTSLHDRATRRTPRSCDRPCCVCRCRVHVAWREELRRRC